MNHAKGPPRVRLSGRARRDLRKSFTYCSINPDTGAKRN